VLGLEIELRERERETAK